MLIAEHDRVYRKYRRGGGGDGVKRTFVRSEILLAQGEIALMRSEIWLRHVKCAAARGDLFHFT